MSSFASNSGSIIAMGNSGVGKSFNLNLMLNKSVFRENTQPGSVTSALEWQLLKLNVGSVQYDMRVCNIPGLVEIDAKNISRNKSAIDAAMSSPGGQIILFVLGLESGGRIRNEDCSAFLALNAAYNFNPGSVVFIFNKKPPSYGASQEAELTAILQRGIHWEGKAMNVVCVDDLGEQGISSPKAAANREKILTAINRCTMARYTKQREIELEADRIRKAQLEAQRQREAAARQEILNKLKLHKEKQELYTDQLANLTGHLNGVACRHANGHHRSYGTNVVYIANNVVHARRGRYTYNVNAATAQLQDVLACWKGAAQADINTLAGFVNGMQTMTNLHQCWQNKVDGNNFLGQFRAVQTNIVNA